jgi:hypothetical protein
MNSRSIKTLRVKKSTSQVNRIYKEMLKPRDTIYSCLIKNLTGFSSATNKI